MSVTKEMGTLAGLLLSKGDRTSAEDILAQQESMEIDSPTIRLTHMKNRAILAEQHGDLDGAHAFFVQALAIANEVHLKAQEAECQERLRELARKRNDFAGYIEHNTAYTEITEAIRGKEATQRIAMLETDRKMETERVERDKERALLYGALPESVATCMLRGDDVSGDHFEQASVLFLDIVGFTSISDHIPPGHVVHLLKAIFSVCDDACRANGVTKIKTIGDSYLAVAGVPEPLDDHAQRAAQAAIDMMKGLNELELTMDPALGDTSWTMDVGEIKVRIGLHCGPVVAGIVGDERLQYDVWGDTVNTASRMESTGEPGRIQCSESFARALCLVPRASGEGDQAPGTWHQALVERGAVEVKGKGSMTTYWLEGA